MDPVIDWLSCKNENVEETQNIGNITRAWQFREQGTNPCNYPPNKTVLENIAEDILVRKPLKIRCCDLPGLPRSTFLMVFSPDGTKVASTHGNHNIYVSELASGKHVRILKGHPRTPWCISFHPSHTQLIGSGCLGGQVRVWDITNGGSEVWTVRNDSVISSLAFHPREQLLVIATYNELYFWDWSKPTPFTKVCTNNVNEKVRYVAFDSLGYKLITGISLWNSPAGPINNSVLTPNTPMPGSTIPTNRRNDPEENPDNNRPPENSGSAQDMIVDSYHNLVQRYDSLVRNYQRLFMVRHQLNSTPPPPNMIDRGTDPMETDTSSNSQSQSEPTGTAELRNENPTQTPTTESNPTPLEGHTTCPTPGPSRQLDTNDSTDADTNSRLLNLDALTFNNPSTSTQPQNTGRPRWGRMLWRRTSAFRPLGDCPPSSHSFRTLDQMEGPRLLPNPFSSNSQSTRTSLSNPQASRVPLASNPSPLLSSTSRTSIFTPTRQESLGRDFFVRRRSLSPIQPTLRRWLNETSLPPPSTSQENEPSNPEVNTTERPATTTTSSQANSSNQDALTINESLDLIRDILRDSGTRLLNLITNMSLSTLASVERHVSRRPNSRAQSEEINTGSRTRDIRPRLLRRVFLSSSSDSDSDQSLEVNIFRTRNATFRENLMDDLPPTNTDNTTDPTERTSQPTDRMEFELNNDSQNNTTANDPEGIHVSLSNRRFRVRTQNESTNNESELEPSPEPNEDTNPTNTSEGNQEEPTEPQPSTSRDNFWTGGVTIPPAEAFRKVRGGVSALQKHTLQLTNMWLRGNRVTMRELRTMWENLRRRVMLLHRETGRQDLPSYYTRSLFERCMMLTELSDSVTRSTRPRPIQRTDNSNVRNEIQDDTSATNNTTNTNQVEREPNNATQNSTPTETRPNTSGRGSQTRTYTLLSVPFRRRGEHANYRHRHAEELRRIRIRNPLNTRIAPRFLNRPRRDFARAIELSATRHEIRMRAMQVLSVMFNMMMMCLEERGLSQLIISMLRTLKKALAFTCLMLMTNRTNVRGSGNIPGPPMNQRGDPLNVVRIQNTDHSESVNVDDPDAEPPSENNTPSTKPTPGEEVEKTQQTTKESKICDTPTPSTSRAETSERHEDATVVMSQRWSNRLAVQIAAANRNHSSTARNRRQLYIESRRLKALHRTNPNIYPQIKKRALPPISPHRIPALRNLPSKSKASRPNHRGDNNNRSNPEPVAGPSREPSGENSNEESPRSEVLYEFEQRVNLIRIAHMQAVRLRNVNRSRFRRLQAIRLYNPSSVREMYAIPSNGGESREGSRSPFQNEVVFREPDNSNRRPVVSYRQRLEPGGRAADELRQFHAALSSVAMPLMQVSDAPAQEPPAARLPRIHDYLQPIILAQNAMVVEEDGGGEGPRLRHLGQLGQMGGVAGLLDGVISEAMPAPVHRLQAWDYSAAAPPDIANSTKNVVVQKCRIHNDASVDISKDGRLLVALLPVPRIRSANHWLGVYSLEWSRLGQCLHTCVLEHSAVSVALSPTARHLAVGLGSRRFLAAAPHTNTNVFALLYRLQPRESSSRTGLSPIKELEQDWEHGFTSLNCLRWAPQPGQGLVYANNTGQLIVMS